MFLPNISVYTISHRSVSVAWVLNRSSAVLRMSMHNIRRRMHKVIWPWCLLTNKHTYTEVFQPEQLACKKYTPNSEVNSEW